MENSKKKPQLNDAWLNAKHVIQQCLASISQHRNSCNDGGLSPRFYSSAPIHFCVGFSGGLDSTVLLHWLAAQQSELNFALSAVHVHHGLSPNADAWAEHAQQIAQALNIPCSIEHVSVTRGHGVEGGARKARYAALAKIECEAIVLAHHQNDQSETLLINLLRGSGPAGLAAMPTQRALNERTALLRPLLAVSRNELQQYASTHQLSWIEDESNLDTGFKRNKIRHELVPLLESINPQAITTIARSAIHQTDAAAILLERAQEDLSVCSVDNALELAKLQTLSPSRQKNLLHFWLSSNGITLELRAFDELIRIAFDAASDACPALVWRQAAIRRYRGALHITHASLESGAEQNCTWGESVQLTDWRGELSWQLGEGGIAEEHLLSGYRVMGRMGGETLKLAANRPTRSLKAHCQAAGIAPWLRETTPLIYINGQLAAMPELGVHSDFQPTAGTLGWLPVWQPSHPHKGIQP